jgi:hypothetical protein
MNNKLKYDTIMIDEELTELELRDILTKKLNLKLTWLEIINRGLIANVACPCCGELIYFNNNYKEVDHGISKN